MPSIDWSTDYTEQDWSFVYSGCSVGPKGLLKYACAPKEREPRQNHLQERAEIAENKSDVLRALR